MKAMLELGILILTLSLFFITHNIRNQTTQSRTQIYNKDRQLKPNPHLTQALCHLAQARSTLDISHSPR